MNVQGQNLGGCTEYGRSVLLSCDLLPTKQERSTYCVSARIGIVGRFHFSRRLIVPNDVLCLCKSHLKQESWKDNAKQKA